MRRIFWTTLGLGFGATAGILAARRLRRTKDALTPSGLAGAVVGALSGVGDALRDFADDIREGMTEREAELTAALGLDDPYPDEPAVPTR